MRRSPGTLGSVGTRIGASALALALPIALVACGGSTTADTAATPSSTTTSTAAVNAGTAVTIETSGGSSSGSYAYDPTPATVKVGQTVTWTNSSGTAHTVTADPGQEESFKSQTIRDGETYVASFSKPGTYTYYCSIHKKESMSGTVVVAAP